MAYSVQVYSKNYRTQSGTDGTLTRTLTLPTSIRVQKDLNKPETITFQVPRNTDDADALELGRVVRILDGTTVISSGVIVGNLDKTRTLIPVTASGKSILLSFSITPWDFKLEADTAADQITELLKNYRFFRQNTEDQFNDGTFSNTEVTSVAVSTTETNYFVTLTQTGEDYNASGTFITQPILCTDDFLGDPADISRLRYVASLGNDTDIKVEFRHANTAADTTPGDSDFSAWSSPYGTSSDSETQQQLGITGYSITGDFRWIQMQFTLTTSDVTITPALQALEIVAEYPSEISAGSISLTGDALDRTFSYESHLRAIQQIVAARNGEFRVNDNYTLDVAERFGVTTPSVTYTVHDNCEVVRFQQQDRRLSTEIWSLQNTGNGLTQPFETSSSDTATETYGARPWLYMPVATTENARTQEITDELALRDRPTNSVIIEETDTREDIAVGDLVDFEYTERSIDTTLRVIAITGADPRLGTPRRIELISDEGFFASQADAVSGVETAVSGTTTVSGVSGLTELQDDVDRLLDEYPLDTLEWRGLPSPARDVLDGTFSGVLISALSEHLVNTTEGDATISVVSKSSNIASATYDSTDDELSISVSSLLTSANGTVTVRASVTVGGVTTTTDETIRVRLVYLQDYTSAISGLETTVSGLETSVSAISTAVDNIPDDIGDAASQSQISGLSGRIDTLSGRVASVSSAVPDTTTFATQSQVSGLSGRIDTLSGRLSSVSGSVPDTTDYATPSQISGLSGRIDTLSGRLSSVSGGVPDTSNLASQSDLDTLETRVTGLSGVAAANATEINNVSGRVASVSGRLSSVSSAVPDTSDYATPSQISGLSGRIDTLSGRVASVSGNLDSVSGKVNSVSGRLSSVSGSVPDTTDYATPSQISGLSGRIDTLGTRVSGLSTAVDAVSNAIPDISNLATESQISGLSGRIDTLSGRVSSVSGNLDSVSGKVNSVSGRLSSVSGAVPDTSDYATPSQISGLSGRIDTLSGRVGNVSGNLDAVSGKINNVSGRLSSVSGSVPDSSDYATPSQISGLSGRIDTLGTRVSGLSTAVDAVSNAIPDISNLATESQISGLSGRIDTLSGRVGNVSGNLDAVSGKVNNVSGRLSSVSSAVPDTTDYATPAQISGLSGRIDTLSGRVGNVSGNLNSVSGKVNSVSGNLGAVSGKVDNVSGNLDAVSGKVNSVSGNLDSVSGKLDTVSGNLDSVSGKLDTTSGGLDTVSGTLTTVSDKLDTTSGGLDTVSGLVSGLSGEIVSVSGDVGTLSGLVSGLSGEIVSVSGDVGTLSGLVSGLSGEIVSVSGDVNTLSGLVSGLSGIAELNTTNVSGLDTRVSGLETTTTDLSGIAETNTDNISGIDTRISGLESTTTDLSGTVSGLSGAVEANTEGLSEESFFNTIRNFITGVENSYIDLDIDVDSRKITVTHTSGLSGMIAQLQSDISGLSGMIDS